MLPLLFDINRILLKNMDSTKIIFVKSNKNKQAVLYKGYKYNHISDNKNGTTFWRCNQRQECSASITINKERTAVIRESHHICLQDYDKTIKDLVMDKAKEKVCSNMKSIKLNFEKSLMSLDNESLEPLQMINFKSVKNTLHRT